MFATLGHLLPLNFLCFNLVVERYVQAPRNALIFRFPRIRRHAPVAGSKPVEHHSFLVSQMIPDEFLGLLLTGMS